MRSLVGLAAALVVAAVALGLQVATADAAGTFTWRYCYRAADDSFVRFYADAPPTCAAGFDPSATETTKAAFDAAQAARPAVKWCADADPPTSVLFQSAKTGAPTGCPPPTPAGITQAQFDAFVTANPEAPAPAGTDQAAVVAAIDSMHSDLAAKLDALRTAHGAKLDQLHADLTAGSDLLVKLNDIKAALVTDGVKLAPNDALPLLVKVSNPADFPTSTGGTAWGQDDAHPGYVKLASSDTTAPTLDALGGAQKQALWYLVGLLCVLAFGYFLYRQVAPRA